MQNSSTRFKVGSKKGTTNGINNLKWYRMYAQQSLYSELVIGTSNTSKLSNMIWGSQWDQIMIWMKEIKSSEQAQSRGKYYVTNGAGKGNYGVIDGVDDENSSRISPATTGSKDFYMVKNVFDLAGNVDEWTLEDSFGNRIPRGGYFNSKDISYTKPDYRNALLPVNRSSSIGSRLVLY